MKTYELSFKKDLNIVKPTKPKGLGNSVLLYNALWFMKVRWIVVIIFIVAALIGIIIPDNSGSLGFIIPSNWLFILALMILVENSILYIFSYKLKKNSTKRTVEANLWFQIIFDLIIITILVHIIGGINTFIAFTYLFHITLACIFFSQKKSLLVTLVAMIMYLISVILELTSIWKSSGIFVNGFIGYLDNPALSLIIYFSAIFVWLVIWYFVSTLSETVRKQDQKLNQTNENYFKIMEEKDHQTIITIHDLKAPLAGIDSNIQVLEYQYWKELSEPIRGIINKINMRAQLLLDRISEILILGDLKSVKAKKEQLVPIDLKKIINSVIEGLNEKIKNRKITIDVNIQSNMILSNMKKLSILFNNLIANAIFYSYEGGKVEIYWKLNKGEFSIFIKDYGIGIREDALSQIFNEYFRTKEAVRFNRMSTGLGLAIVKEIVRDLSLRIRVSSDIEKGTSFEVFFPEKIKKQTIDKGA